MRRASSCGDRFFTFIAAGLVLIGITGPVWAAAPSLPKGLEPGTSENGGSEPPALPPGLGKPAELPSPDERTPQTGSSPVLFGGFADARFGLRVSDDPYQADSLLREIRIQLEAEKEWDHISFRAVADILYDGVLHGRSVDLETGEGALDLREASLLYRTASWLDVKAGRQILTWGTGDLIFINDLFPKDWNSFFIGRDMEYLKAPSDSFKFSAYTTSVNVDVAYTPRFDPDRYIDGYRISFYDPSLDEIVGRNNPLKADIPDEWYEDDEVAVRLYGNIGSWEAALYGYDGYWKSPNGFDGATGNFTFPRLTVIGASARGQVSGGIGSLEAGYYSSRDDPDGSDPLVRNSEWRVLVGYEKELAPELTGSVQYYLEEMADHDAYLSSLPASSPARDHRRHVMTLRLTKLAMNQNLRLSLFNFYSPSDEDGYLRLGSIYKMTDALRIEIGGNLFYGRENHTFFGQFEDASNVYAGVRRDF